MSNQSPDERVHEDLARAVMSGLLPDRAHEQAEKLLTRLETPVRLCLLGLPESGKSTILNLLIGQELMQIGVRMPTCQVVYGRVPQAVCTLSDGSRVAFDTIDLDQIAAQSPAFVEIRLPLPALKKISVLEVVAPTDPVALHRASQWASKRCDIAIWCTADYSQDEQRVWSQMPDALKDHALLMITRYDLLQQQGLFEEVSAAVHTAAAGEFNKIIPIATRAAIAARDANGSVDKEAFRRSGGMALISAVLKQVDQGRRSALDLAEVLLLQNEDALASMDAVMAADEAQEAADDERFAQDAADRGARATPAAAKPDPVATPDKAEPAAARDAARDTQAKPSAPAVAPKPAGPKFEIAKHAQPTISPMQRRETTKTPDQGPREPERVSVGIARLRSIAARRAEQGLATPPAVEVQAATRTAYEHAIAHLEQKAAALSEQIMGLGDDAPAAIISQAVEDLNWLCDYLNANGDDEDPALARARDTAFDAADLVQLMQMEKRDSAAIEALSLMLQVKRELQADLAA
ncbi:hypothetical protein [Yoonia sp.]|uniref:hypothetical protein n=1 Tax=Yoonia sp. TaxID=2212373 RepID=UPI002FDA94D1